MTHSPITTHVLDTARGQPAAGMPVQLFRNGELLATAHTDANGRVSTLLPPASLPPGAYQLRFDISAYAARHDQPCFFPEATISFVIAHEGEHYHIPLLLSPYGYTTYRGSH